MTTRTSKGPVVAKEKALTIKDLNEAADVLREIGLLEIESQRLKEKATLKVAEINRVLDEALEPQKMRIAKLGKALKKYAVANREILTAEGKKTIVVSSGEFGWRLSPESVKLTDDAEVVLANFKLLGLTEYIRTKEEIDKEAILRDHPTIIGISIGQEEKFFLKPGENIEPGARLTL